MILRIKRKKINKILLCSVLFWVLLVYIFDSVSKNDNLKELKELKMKESINAGTVLLFTVAEKKFLPRRWALMLAF